LIGIGVLAGASGAGCYSGGPLGGSSPAPSSSTGASEPDAGIPFQADPPDVYVAKVKNILTGLAPTSDELNQVVADPTALSALVTKWQTDPAFAPFYQAKMQVFFELAFQQTQINAADFAQMIPEGGGIGVSGTLTNLLVQNVRESFARTMVAMTTANQPFTNSFTTNQFMMTPPLMELYAFLDSNQIRDDESVNDRFKAANAGVSIMMEASAGAIPLSETLDSTSPNYMHWYYPDVASVTNTAADCNVDPRVYPATADTLHLLMYGSLQNYKGSAGTLCGFFGGKVTDSQFTTADFSAWKLVTVRQPVGGEATTQFFNVPALRTANELVLSTPRIGFFTTPAFFANWQTNTSNEMRVTMNQTLIVGTGMDVDGTDKTTTGATPPGLDSAHAAVGSACFGCHQTLDPSRSVFQNVYSYGYGNQDEAALVSQPGEFAFQGVIQPVSSMTDLGSVLKNHPAFAQAWVEKLCYYVNSQPCAPDDPELTRIVGDFKTGGYNWNALVHDLVTSPITTNATESRTAAEEGELVAVSRRDHFCALLNNRLGLVDVCGLDALSAKAKIATIAEVASGLPSDGYGRGAPIPVLPNAPSLFSRAGTENICEGVAQELVDATTPIAGALQISSAQSATSIQTLVSTLMGLPTSDPRNAQAVTVLTSHYTSAMSQGASATDAMKSTFITACLAPSVVGMGM
jgi:hypothetical protein